MEGGIKNALLFRKATNKQERRAGLLVYFKAHERFRGKNPKRRKS